MIKNARPHIRVLLRLAGLFSLAALSLSASAAWDGPYKLIIRDGKAVGATVADARSMATGGTAAVLGASVSGGDASIVKSLTAVSPVAGFDSAVSTSAGLAVNALGDVVMRAGVSPGLGTSPAVIDVEAKLVKSSMAAAVGKAIAKSLPVLSTGMALYDIVKEMGYDIDPATKKVVRNGFDGSCNAPDPAPSLIEGACRDALSDNGSCSATTFGIGGNNCAKGVQYHSDRFGTGRGAITIGTYDTPPTMTGDEALKALTDKIAAQSGWPTSSTIAKALSDAIKGGESVSLQQSTASGPASIPGPTQSVKNSDGSSSDQKTKFDCTYSVDVVNCKQTDTTTTTDPSGKTATTVVTNDKGTTAPTEQSDLCKLHPEIIACQQLGEAPTPDVLKKTESAIQVVAADFASAAACPAPLNFDVLTRTYAISYGPICNLMTLLRPVVLVLSFAFAAFLLADSFKV